MVTLDFQKKEIVLHAYFQKRKFLLILAGIYTMMLNRRNYVNTC